jgi:hypothetical protein
MSNKIEDRIKHAKNGFEFYVNQYMQLFCDKHGLEYNESLWIGRKGDIIEIADMVINFSDIRIDLEENVNKDIFLEWYWNVTESELPHINYSSWIKGLRHKDLK